MNLAWNAAGAAISVRRTALRANCFAIWLAALLAAAAPSIVGAEDRVQFNRDVRPILSENCYYCHGPDATHREADLRLDVRAEAVAAEALVPGKPELSELVARILSDDPDSMMPPPKAHKVLDEREKAVLQRWIAEGAEYQGHWAFLPPERPEVPAITDAAQRARAVNPIDHFVMARLAQEKLTLSPEADRATLIRRVSLDLTGIPPTPAEVDALLADTTSQAYENLVDRLLQSPRYGERMAQQWLDYARYADSNGFQTDSSRQMWRWRDWVLDAFNRNLPFDQFTVEQLAGDMLPDPTPEQVIATGFHRNPRLNGEGGRIVEEWFAETVIDRVDTTGQTWLGLTLGCCRCHDHKYDPITQKDFYQLFAFFNSIDETGVLDSEGGNRGGGNSRPVVPAPTAEQREQEVALELAIREAEQRVGAAEQQLAAAQTAASGEQGSDWDAAMAAVRGDQTAAGWEQLEPTAVASQGGTTFIRLDDGSYLAGGPNPARDVYTITGPLPAGALSGLRLEVFPDASLPNQSLGRATNGNFVLTGLEAEITAPSLAQAIVVKFVKAAADYDQPGYEVQTVVGNPPGKGWAINGNEPAKRLPRRAMFVAEPVAAVPADSTLVVRLKFESQFQSHQIGRFRLATTGVPPTDVSLEGDRVPEAVRAAGGTEPERRSAEQRAALAAYFATRSDNPLGRATAELAAARRKRDEFRSNYSMTTMVMQELPKPREAFVLVRGEYDKRGEKVERALPAALPPLPDGAPLNRLGLAQWLVAPDHPLTARVWVNRQWEKFFGTGLVKTIDNFGLQSEPPSHPELLDWLATEFVRLGWDMKALQKEIVMSATYRQSSRVAPELFARDPENRLLARGPRFRLSAELVRDQALAVSGLLVEKVGGPSVRPYMPAGVWDETSKYGDLRGYKPDQGDGLYRRSLYTIWKRTAAPPTMLMFDSPSREVCAVKRSRTNTPLQALALLNEVTYVEAARTLAQRMLTAGGTTPRDRIAWAFRRVTCRLPDDAELQVLLAGFERYAARFRADAAAAEKLLTMGAARPDPALDKTELAAYTLTANILLNLDEVVTKE